MKKLFFKAGSIVFNHLKKMNKTSDEPHYREVYPAESVQNKRFYNIGAGEFDHPCWTNVDGGSEYYETLYSKNNHHIRLDLFDHKPLPVADNTAELVYTSHTIEHVDDASVAYLFKDVYRILKQGGTLRIVTPDMDLQYDAWKRNDRRFYFWLEDEELNKKYKEHNLKITEGMIFLNS